MKQNRLSSDSGGTEKIRDMLETGLSSEIGTKELGNWRRSLSETSHDSLWFYKVNIYIYFFLNRLYKNQWFLIWTLQVWLYLSRYIYNWYFSTLCILTCFHSKVTNYKCPDKELTHVCYKSLLIDKARHSNWSQPDMHVIKVKTAWIWLWYQPLFIVIYKKSLEFVQMICTEIQLQPLHAYVCFKIQKAYVHKSEFSWQCSI